MLASDIKNKASEIMYSSKDILFKVFVVMGIISTIANSLSGLLGGMVASIVSMIVLVAFLPFQHGYVVSTLKAVNNRSEEITIEEDGFVGFKRFKELFGTYFVYNFLLFIILFVVILVGLVFVVLITPTMPYVDFASLVVDATNPTALLSLGIDFLLNILYILFPMIVLVCVVIIIYSLTFGLTPFLLERKGLRGTAAMKESMRLMKGYKWLLFKVELSFIGWMILCMFISSLVGMFLPYTLIINLINVVVSVYLYDSKLKVCNAVLFEEIMIEKGNVE